MALSGSQKAQTWARSGIGRSGATRSNYVLPWTGADLIVRDGAGNIISRTDLIPYIRAGSLTVNQALNDEADTCSFQIVPTAPAAAVPQVGQEIHVAWAPGDPIFQGYALVVQFDRRVKNESPWVSVQCQDAMWRFDARIVTYRFPNQSVTASIVFLVQFFCNDPLVYSPRDFVTTFVQPDMPTLPAFDVVNQRPSTVMRTLMAAVGGGFYIAGLDVHAWAGGLSEPNQTNPTPLTNSLASLKAFRVTHDATQIRRRVLVEGRRTQTLIGWPTIADVGIDRGAPLQDATLFNLAGGSTNQLTRIGTQWMYITLPTSVTANGANPPQTRTKYAYAVGSTGLAFEPVPVMPPPRGWIRLGNQYCIYDSISGDPLTGEWAVAVATAAAGYTYGFLTVPIPAGETVEFIDNVFNFLPFGLRPTLGGGIGDPTIRTEPTDTPVVILATAQVADPAPWPPLESFVQDGRYSYAGAQARADADLAAFQDPLVSATWETEDTNARPGRVQQINLTGLSVIDPVNLTLTITRVELSFPLRTLPPRRICTGGDVKPSTFLDLVLTDPT